MRTRASLSAKGHIPNAQTREPSTLDGSCDPSLARAFQTFVGRIRCRYTDCMNIFGVGPLELIVVLIVALVFVGPDRLPKLAADLARTIREIRKYTGGLAAEFNEVIKDVEKETAGEKGLWKEVSEGIGGATQQVTEAVRGARQELFKAEEAASTAGTPSTVAPTAITPPIPNGSGAASGWTDIPEPGATAEPTAALNAEPSDAPDKAL